MNGIVRSRGRGVVFIGKGLHAAGTLLRRLDGVPAFKGVAQVGHGLAGPGIGNPDGKAHQVRAVIFPAVAEHGDLTLLGR